MKFGRKYRPKSKDVVKLNEYIESNPHLSNENITVKFNAPTKAEAEGRTKSKRKR